MSCQVICACCAFSLWKGHLSSPAAPEGVITDRCDHPRLSCLSPLSLQTHHRTHAQLRHMGPCPCFIDFYSTNFLIIPVTSLTLLQLSYAEQRIILNLFSIIFQIISQISLKFQGICNALLFILCMLKGTVHPKMKIRSLFFTVLSFQTCMTFFCGTQKKMFSFWTVPLTSSDDTVSD